MLAALLHLLNLWMLVTFKMSLTWRWCSSWGGETVSSDLTGGLISLRYLGHRWWLMCERRFLRRCNTCLLPLERKGTHNSTKPLVHQSPTCEPGSWAPTRSMGKWLLTGAGMTPKELCLGKPAKTEVMPPQRNPRGLCTTARQQWSLCSVPGLSPSKWVLGL